MAITLEGVPEYVDRNAMMVAFGQLGFSLEDISALDITIDAVHVRMRAKREGRAFIDRDTSTIECHIITIPILPPLKEVTE